MIINNGLINMKKGYWVSLYFKIENQDSWAVAKKTTKRHMQVVEGFSTE